MESARRAVEMWRDRLAAAARNIADLNDSDAVRRLRARLAGAGAFEGATLAEARRIAAALDALWTDFLLVSRTVEDAAALLRRPLFGVARADEAAALLEGATIHLPAVAVPLGTRGLLDAAERSQAVTPAAVLDAMARGFESARRGAGAIFAAETAGRVKLGALRAGPAAREPAFAARLDAAARALDRDPLRAADLLSSLAGALAEARTAAEAGLLRRADLDAALCRARAELADLSAALARLRAARGGGEGPGEEASADLAEWLGRLTAAAEAGQGEAVRLGLDRWAGRCAAARRAIDAEADAASAVGRARDDARGRFRALRAKAEALAMRGRPPSADPGPVAAALEADPFDAERVRGLLGGYEAALAGPHR